MTVKVVALCNQAELNQQNFGKDNEANGFIDQTISNASFSFTPNPNHYPVTNTTPITPPPEPETCLECFDFYLSPEQITALEDTVFPQFADIAAVCDILESGGGFLDESLFVIQLAAIGVESGIAGDLIQCLKDAGVVFEP